MNSRHDDRYIKFVGEGDVENNKVLAFCQPNSNLRDVVKRSLASYEYDVFFISSIHDVKPGIADINPGYYLQDWSAVDETQGKKLQLQLDKFDSYAKLYRIVLVEKINIRLQAFSYDARIDLIKSYSNAINLGQTLSMGQQSGLSDLQNFVRNVKANRADYNQEVIDSKVDLAYQKFPHDNKIALEYTCLTYRREQYHETCRLANDILQRDVTNVRASNLYSRALMKLGDFEKAAIILDKANVLSPQNPERLVMLGDAFYGKGDLEKALEFYEGAHVEDDRCVDAIKGVGQVKIEQGRVGEVVDLFKGSLSEDESASFFNNSAVIAVKGDKLLDAIKLYEIALKTLSSDTYRPKILTNMAITCRRLGDHKKALRCVKAALKTDPNFERALRQYEALRGITD